MKKLFFLIPIILLADVNPFNAGNLNSSSPYGLTPDEKAILSNKKNIQKIDQNIQSLQQNLAKIKFKLSNYNEIIKDKLSAMPTVIDEINSAMNDISVLKKEYNQTQNQIKNLQNNINSLNQKVNSLENNITDIKESIQEIVKIQNQNFLTLKQSIVDIVNKLNRLKQPISAKDAFYKAKKYYIDGKLNEAKKYFIYALSKNYMPATSSFYLGEIAYKKKDYKEALAYYKNSVKLYPKKTGFGAELLYHTGKSFLYLNNKKAAKLSFEKLIADYPKSKLASFVKKDLAKLK